MILQLGLLLLLPLLAVAAAKEDTLASAATSMSKPGCLEKCGDVTVPYPFGVGEDPKCSLNDRFQLDCQYPMGSDSNASPMLMLGGFPVLNISVVNATAMVNVSMAYSCYDKAKDRVVRHRHRMSLTRGPFTFSATGNKFITVGCDTQALMRDSEGIRFGSGCISLCYRSVNFTQEDGRCSGEGCCQTKIPKGVKTLNISITSLYNSINAKDFGSCSYAFVAREDWNEFSSINLSYPRTGVSMAPAILDWVVGNKSCESFGRSSSASACGNNTQCVNSDNSPGYRCACKTGYQGNPYLSLPQGCQDINECLDPKTYPCKGKCKNTLGNYTCRCPLGMHGDGKVACQGFRVTTLVAVCGMVMLLIVMIPIFWMGFKRRNKLRNFELNGGSLLKRQKIRIFSTDELEKATDKYNNRRLLGKGGSASVYKGVLSDKNKTMVAVKKPNEANMTKIKQLQREVISEQFQHEIDILSQVHHKNVVKLLGLCLDTKVPLLVYEYVSNGSLFDHLHVKFTAILESWTNRLRIAAEIAVALDYLHSSANPPIIHRDIKSMNILLDENFTTKVSDFGASVLIPLGQSFVDTKVQGTCGYWDPEYLITGLLTTKSDVYSFGVVLMELLTGQKPISNQGFEENMNFIQYFISSVEQKNFAHVLKYSPDVDVDHRERENEEMEAVAELARTCLNRSGVERPTMKDVADQLLGIKKIHETFRACEGNEETVSLLGDHVGNENRVVFQSTSNTEYVEVALQ